VRDAALHRRDGRAELLAEGVGGAEDPHAAPGVLANQGKTDDFLEHAGNPPPVAEVVMDEERLAQAAKHFVSSNGEHFLNTGQTKVLGHAGHFTFSSTCSDPSGQPGAQQATFDVSANTTADMDLDANGGAQPAGTKINIHTNSDAMDSTTQTPLTAGAFDQVASALSSTEIAADGQEVDVFYNDGVNWPAGNGGAAHACFAGYTGFVG
jgi:hypothetical protein